MSELVLYRKYRPGKWDEVMGQEHIVSVLKGAIKAKNIAHAYLFSGSRGTGKTSVARILAREIGCEVEDLYEIDAASNRGIDDVRELREGVRALPFRSPYKVYIIDEVHMLTKDAFNALLKTLEDPPAHAVFILATTELYRVLETIISRCQSFVFKKPSLGELEKHILFVAKKEGYTVEKGAAYLMASLGEGSFRDTLGILQKIISISKDKAVNLEEVIKVTGAPKTELLRGIIESIVKKEADKALSLVSQAMENDIDMKVLTKLLMEKIRSAMLIIFAPDIREEIEKELSPDEYDFLAAIGKGEGGKMFPSILRELLSSYELISASPVSALPLELAIIKIIGQDK